MIDKKRSFSYLVLVALAASLVAFNIYLWHLQAGKKQLITGLQSQVQLHEKENKILTERNHSKVMEVETLRSPDSAYIYEEKAREEYGMIGKNETFFVLMKDETKNIPNVEGLNSPSEKITDALSLPERTQPTVVTLESIVDPPVVSPADADNDDNNKVNNTPAPPTLQLESLK